MAVGVGIWVLKETIDAELNDGGSDA
jgi:hypothetical protein